MKITITLVSALATGALTLAACGAPAPEPTTTPAGDAVAGQAAFAASCSSCHGPEGKGIAGLGKDLTTSEWVVTQSDADLVAFLQSGRPASDPLNTTGIDMPPKGGNPALSEADLENIVAYMRSIHQTP
jgi:disulfide bond formation protein DsbB